MSPHTARGARTGRSAGVGADAGYVFPVVIAVVVVVTVVVGAMTTMALHVAASTRGERAASQARASAEAGVAEALAEIARASTPQPGGALPTGVFKCSYHVNELNHTPRGQLFYYVDLRYGSGGPGNAPSSTQCAPPDARRTAAVPQPGTITLVARGGAVGGRRAVIGTGNGERGYNTHSIDVVLTNVGTQAAPVWSVTTWRDRPDS